MDILKAAKELTGVNWVLRGDELTQAEEPGIDKVTPPTSEAIQAHIDADPIAYREKRRKEYPPMGDQLDALWKGGQDEADMRIVINGIKSKYPKPS